jgi:hypothetical protein
MKDFFRFSIIFLASLAQASILVVSCGQTQMSDDKASADSVRHATALASKADLGECETENSNQLIYVLEDKSFYVCDGYSWKNIEIKGVDGKDGENGDKISKITELLPLDQDLCTSQQFADQCYFKGGQIVTYSDGSFSMSATLSYTYLGSLDTDTYIHSPSWFYKNTDEIAYLVLTTHGTSSGKSGIDYIWLLYNPATGKAGIMIDSNDNFVPDENDEFLAEIDVSS